MADEKTLFIVRHGQTEWNVGGRMQGRLDSPLTLAGCAQADSHGRALKSLGGVEAVFASPLGRTRHTADLLNAHLEAPLTYEPALMERDCGAWSGLTTEQIAAGYPESWRARAEDPYFHRPPGGENLEDMRARVSGFLAGLLESGQSRLALVTHGIMSRVIIRHLLDLPPLHAVSVRHPNELFYRLQISASRIEAAHFVAGEGPLDGLLRYAD